MATPETLQTSIKFARAKVSSSTVFRKVDRLDRVCSLLVSCNGGGFSSGVLASPVKLASFPQGPITMSEGVCRLPTSRVEGPARSTEAMMKVKYYAASIASGQWASPVLSVIKDLKTHEKNGGRYPYSLWVSMGSFDPRATTQAERGRDEVQGEVLFCFRIRCTQLTCRRPPIDRFTRCHVTR